ncbi:MAG: rhombosortase [Pontibacterium sp.]
MLKHYVYPHMPLLLFVLLTLCVLLMGDAGREILRFERESVLAGEWYRLISAHFVHTNTVHALMNITALSLIWFLFYPVLRPGQWLLALLICSLSTSLGLLFFTGYDWYVGLSGVIHGLMLMAFYLDRRLGRGLNVLLIAGLLIKVLYEITIGASRVSQSLISADVIEEAHLYGLLGGILIVLLIQFKRSVLPVITRTK